MKYNNILRMAERFYKLGTTPYNLFIRFGKFKSGQSSKIMLDTEFRQEVLHGKQYESGLSVLFAESHLNGFRIIPPSKSRAQYGLPYDYVGDMISRLWIDSIARGDIYLLKGDLIEIPETVWDDLAESWEHTGNKTYDVGSDGEPVIENPSIIKKLEPSEVYLPGTDKTIDDIFRNKINDAFFSISEYYLEMSMHNEELRSMIEDTLVAPDVLIKYEDIFGKKRMVKFLDELSDLWDNGQKIPVEQFLESKNNTYD